MNETDTIKLLERAQYGDDIAENRFIALIRDHHMIRRVRKYHDRNVLVENDDIDQEFMVGCFEAMHEAKLDVGNPLLYILWRGEKKVQSLFRKRLRKGVRYECRRCQDKRSVYSYNGRVECSSCGSRNVRTWMVMESAQENREDDTNEWSTHWESRILQADTGRTIGEESNLAWERATFGKQIEEMRARLSGRKLELFDILILEDLNRRTSNNYLKEIAERWGVTTACVSIHLRGLREEVRAYIETGGPNDQARA